MSYFNLPKRKSQGMKEMDKSLIIQNVVEKLKEIITFPFSSHGEAERSKLKLNYGGLNFAERIF